jgi:hypothetical protein
MNPDSLHGRAATCRKRIQPRVKAFAAVTVPLDELGLPSSAAADKPGPLSLSKSRYEGLETIRRRRDGQTAGRAGRPNERYAQSGVKRFLGGPGG